MKTNNYSFLIGIYFVCFYLSYCTSALCPSNSNCTSCNFELGAFYSYPAKCLQFEYPSITWNSTDNTNTSCYKACIEYNNVNSNTIVMYGCWWLDGTGGFPADCRVCQNSDIGPSSYDNDHLAPSYFPCANSNSGLSRNSIIMNSYFIAVVIFLGFISIGLIHS